MCIYIYREREIYIYIYIYILVCKYSSIFMWKDILNFISTFMYLYTNECLNSQFKCLNRQSFFWFIMYSWLNEDVVAVQFWTLASYQLVVSWSSLIKWNKNVQSGHSRRRNDERWVGCQVTVVRDNGFQSQGKMGYENNDKNVHWSSSGQYCPENGQQWRATFTLTYKIKSC